MTQAKHTPGPWFKSHRDDIRKDATLIARCSRLDLGEHAPLTDDEAQANARLIAAAPETAAERDRLKEINAELLEALILVDGLWTTDALTYAEEMSSGSPVAIVWEKVRAAIAKATVKS